MVKFEEHTVTYNTGEDKKLFYLATGPVNGPLLIFIHGWPAIGKTWAPQLEAFALLGFRTVAPDMPGYGGSTANKIAEDYSMENVNKGMLALLQHLDRDKAVWIGHDWGAPAVWSLAAHYPEVCLAVCGISVPYCTVDLGLTELVKTVNREIYPEDQYPWGQWDYQRFYETSFEAATAWFDSDIPACLRAMYSKGNPDSKGKPAITSAVIKNGGWFGGRTKPDPAWREILLEKTCLSEVWYEDLVKAMEKTGFWGADAWYSNHERNREYFYGKAKNEGRLEMPVLFVETEYDTVCDTANSTMTETQRKLCANLTETSIAAGHWAAQEKPAEVNAAIAKWLVEKVGGYWPAAFTRTSG